MTNPPASSDAFDDDAGDSTYPLKPSEGHGSDEASDDTTYPTILPPKRDETPEAHGNSDREARADRDSAREKLSLTQIGPYRLLEKLGESIRATHLLVAARGFWYPGLPRRKDYA